MEISFIQFLQKGYNPLLALTALVAGGMLPIGALIGGALGTLLGVPATLVVAAFGMLLAVLWLCLSPVRILRALPAIES